MYSYICDWCGAESEHLTFNKIGGILIAPCNGCEHTVHKRAICRIHTHGSMPEHFNNSTGQYVTNKNAFKSQLAEKSDEMSERMGVDIKYTEVDPNDRKALGVTSEGVHDSIAAEKNPIRRNSVDKAFS